MRSLRSKPGLTFVLALRAEAEPLIDHFDLRLVDDGAAPRFANPERRIQLLISGIGRTRAAAAVAAATTPPRRSAWLNVGIAGHADLAVGSPRMAHRVECVATGQRWFPSLTFEPPCPTATVRTVAEPCTDFPTRDLYEMEAAGFVEAAGRQATRELVQVLKIVSDNHDEPAAELDRGTVGGLVANSLPIVDELAENLLELAAELAGRDANPTHLNEILATAHFTTSQRRQLRRCLRRWSALRGGDAAAWLASRHVATASEILSALDERIQGRMPRLPRQR